MQLSQIQNYTQELLCVGQFKDYCPNGLQIEGKPEVQRLVSGVTTNQALIDAAIDLQADAIIVHHGFFWKNEASPIVGLKKNRIKALLDHNISLLAYHLPLDAHPTLGNNAQLGRVLGLQSVKFFGEQNLIAQADTPSLTVADWAKRLTQALGRTPLLIGDAERKIKRIAWCTGGAQSYLEAAIDAGADAFITGEASESIVHLARESGVAYFAAGHHATERYGIQALGAHLADAFQLWHQYVDIDSPV